MRLTCCHNVVTTDDMKSETLPEGDPPKAKSIRLPKSWPHVIRNGDVSVKIYRNNGNVRGRNFRTFVVSYYANGQRQLRRFTEFAVAYAEADRVATQKAQGTLGAAALSPKDRVSLELALALLSKTDGVSHTSVARLVEIVRDYAAARVHLPQGVTLAETAHFYKHKHPANMPRKTVSEVVTEFIADRKSAGCSAIHTHDLGVRLGQFSRAFTVPIMTVNPSHVQQWIYGLKNHKNKNDTSARTKENMLRQVVSLFNFARRQKYAPTELAIEISEIPTPKKQPAPIGVYTADAIRALLAAADSEITPALAVSAFAGLRLAEVARLDWSEVRLSEKLIVVEANKAKTAARRLVPISNNLAAWLRPYAKRSGPVNPCIEQLNNVGNALGDRFERAAARAKVAWKRNGFRHSYISYRVAVLKDVPAVALECGNSPQVIFSNYRALATGKEGKAWFAVRPPKVAANVIPMRRMAIAPRQASL